MDIRNTRQLKDFSAGRLANAREGQKIILYFSLITIAVSAVATVVSYILSQQIAKTGGLGSMGVRSALTTVQMLLPIVQAVFLMCLTLGYLATMLRIARGQYASPNGMRLGFDRFWVLLRCTLLKGLIFGGVAAASLYVAMMIYMMTPLSNAAVDILTSDTNYVMSELWKRHEIFLDSEEERLSELIPRVVTLYKSKTIEAIIGKLKESLADEALSEEEQMSIMENIAALNEVRTRIAKKISRLIL